MSTTLSPTGFSLCVSHLRKINVYLRMDFFGNHMLQLQEHIDIFLLVGYMWYLVTTSIFQFRLKPFVLLYEYIRAENHRIPYELKLIYNTHKR